MVILDVCNADIPTYLFEYINLRGCVWAPVTEKRLLLY